MVVLIIVLIVGTCVGEDEADIIPVAHFSDTQAGLLGPVDSSASLRDPRSHPMNGDQHGELLLSVWSSCQPRSKILCWVW